MMNTPPAQIGAPLGDVETPALILDLAAYEWNVSKLQGFADEVGILLRPHAKTHKCAAIALHQIEMGAVGVCCQKTSEAAALIEAGVTDVFITNEVVGEPKIERLAKLVDRATLRVCVDNPENVTALSRAMESHGRQLDVMVEVDVGAQRCGVATAEEALSLARQVLVAPGLRFNGLQAYHGGAQHIREFRERRAAARSAIAKTAAVRDLLDAEGIECEIVSGGGTGSYPFEAASGVYTELQCGSYIFMDVDYARNLEADGRAISEFKHSLFVCTTVMSKTRPDTVVVDAGLKAVSIDSGMPDVYGSAGLSYTGASDEHGKLAVTQPDTPVTLGDKLMLVPGHCDPTVNLYDWLVGYRDGRVAALWPVTARGCLL
ncbi:MAG: DSD1 family PLP-dependent enzyme [Gammaproteobacteria bacterium]|nr:DSD1 family PLP-dependent enzyme [Gammaproteobacteria bacterium]